MKINKREILQNLFNKNYNFVKNQTLNDVINHYIKETNRYYIGMGITNYLNDEEVIELKIALSNKKLKNAFEDVKT
jgi:alcohol dehydrogenase YqhD (iron-dependent ADH family)